MEFDYSPSQSAGGTVHLSPAHVRRVDSISGMRRLRRALSKSPSRSNLDVSRSSSASPAPQSPTLTPSPLRSVSTTMNAGARNQSSIADISYLPSAKKFRPTLRRTTPLRIFTDSTTPSKFQVRRALSDSSDQGNGSPVRKTDLVYATDGQENSSSSSVSPEDAAEPHGPRLEPLQKRFALTLSKSNGHSSDEKEMGRSSKSSPLKRSDGVINLDRAHLGSPSGKRKSIHGGFLSSPFDIPQDDWPQVDDADLDDANDSDDEQPVDDPLFRSPLAPRFASLRRTTLQQRNSEGSSMIVPRHTVDGTSHAANNTRLLLKARPRSSLDSAMPSQNFEEQSLASATDDIQHQQSEIPRSQYARLQRTCPHPLSQALSPTSPSPCRQDVNSSNKASSFQIPTVPAINFAKSLPIGALRPNARSMVPTRGFSKPSHGSTIATPEAYKMARPDPAAFRSTGLISKRHRNPDDLPPPPGGHLDMPDTPCKKWPLGFAFASSPTPVNSVSRTRFAQPEFGTPSKPFNPHPTRPTPGSLGKSVSVFGSNFKCGNTNKRASFASFDGDDNIQSPSAPTDSQSSADELPPTPTKQTSGVPIIKPPSLRSSLFGRRPSIGPTTFLVPDAAEQPLQSNPLLFQPSRSNVGPRSSPKTPADGTFPDPSGLSISPRLQNPASPMVSSGHGNSTNYPPETPTHREGVLPVQNYLMTPSNRGSARDVDPVLISKFKRVERYGKGEFSEVYKVYESPDIPSQSYFSPSLGSKSLLTPRPDKVWIVKRSKVPYTSMKIRTRRLQEVSIMKSLGKSDHVVHLIDSWEANYHLYIRTEFCEEGSLEAFLARTGHRGRLDDFRIWKILIELSHGLKHIHDCGFIHLDLKPANIFIDFEGVLKIGDFGMASQWPAPCDVEGEGDRRYIGPDLLQGQFNKPADVFALGMMMFEIAGNCIPPDNGASWQKLRSGDWSGLPSLTCSSSHSMFKDSQGDSMTGRSLERVEDTKSHESLDQNGNTDDSFLFDLPPSNGLRSELCEFEDLAQPPKFMLDPDDEEALDKVVHWMMSPRPQDRPVVSQILETGGVHWVNARRRAGAVVFEGNWGPPNHVLRYNQEDEEMLDAP